MPSPLDYKEWKQVKNIEALKTLAIEAALASDWQEAAKINEKIISTDKTDIQALNRVARAYACCGKIAQALKSYKMVLDIDPYNIIARKNFEKLSKLDPTGHPNGNGKSTIANDSKPTQKLSDIFLFEPGKTKVLNLLNLAPPYVLASLNCGDKVELNLKKHGASVTKSEGTYLGALPDDLAHKIIYFIDGGNKYEVYVKSASTKILSVFIREVFRSQRFINQPSFAQGLTREEKNLAFA